MFNSYSHSDIQYVSKISDILEKNGLTPVWDWSLRFGGFHEQIENYIAHAHVFLPVLTVEANKRGWVHQEIGFAKALRIPIIPIFTRHAPGIQRKIDVFDYEFNYLLQKNGVKAGASKSAAIQRIEEYNEAAREAGA